MDLVVCGARIFKQAQEDVLLSAQLLFELLSLRLESLFQAHGRIRGILQPDGVVRSEPS
jgi:hypothetical protein